MVRESITSSGPLHKVQPDRPSDLNFTQVKRVKPDRLVDRVADVDLRQILNLPGRALLTEYQAAAALNLSVRTLRDWRNQNIGPHFIKLNGKSVRYRLSELEAYQDLQPAGGGEAGGPRKERSRDLPFGRDVCAPEISPLRRGESEASDDIRSL
jgi:hypothetical protein